MPEVPVVHVEVPVVHVVDDDPAVRDAIALMLLQRHWAVRAFASASAFLEAVGPDPFGCLLLGRPGPGGPDDLAAELQRRRIGLPIVPLAPVPVEATEATEASGAASAHPTTPPWYRDALESHVNQAVAWHAERRSPDWDAPPAEARREELTRREEQVLRLLKDGLSSKLIGRELGISHRTVDVHRANVLRKVGASSVSQLRRG